MNLLKTVQGNGEERENFTVERKQPSYTFTPIEIIPQRWMRIQKDSKTTNHGGR